MTFPQKEAFPTEKQSALIAIVFTGVLLLLTYLFVIHPQVLADRKMLDDWKAQIATDKKEMQIEQTKLKTISCSELKIAIGNNEFTQLNQQANNQYLGRCT